MIRILVVDDNIEKQGRIVRVIQEAIGERDDVKIDTATYVIDAKTILSKTSDSIAHLIVDI